MLRLQADRFGEPGEVLRVVDDAPAPGDLQAGQVRLRPVTVGLNFLDVMVCRGQYPQQPPPPLVPGVELVGEVVEAAGGPFAVGDRVVACPTLPQGALADLVTVDAGLCTAVPSGADPVLVAALPVTYQTAWFALRRAQLQAGETVLVHAGAGGVGIATIQLARWWGAQVIAVAGGPAKTAVCTAQGATTVVDHQREDFTEVVRQVTAGAGVDVVVDPVGGDTFTRSLGCLAFEGRVVAVGAAGGLPPAVDPMAMTAANTTLVGLSWGSAYPWRRPEQVASAYQDLVAGLGTHIRPVIDRVVSLDGATEALTDLAQRRTIGKVVVRW